MNSSNQSERRQFCGRRGVMVPLVGFMLVVVFGVIAFVADIGNVIVVRTTLGAAADAAALAGAGALAESYNLPDIKPIAVEYGMNNVPANYGEVMDLSSVTFGVWDASERTFTPTNNSPNAVRVVAQRVNARGNQVPYFFGRVMGFESTEVTVDAVAVGANSTSTPLSDRPKSVYVTSTKELSNVVIQFTDGTTQKFEGLKKAYSGTFQGTGEYAGKEIESVWIKSGCNESGEGPGYGERIDYPGNAFTVYGENQSNDCIPKVSATFAATGAEFVNSGSPSPVRLVK